MTRSATRRQPESPPALDQYRRRAGRYDQELLVFEPIRTQAIAALAPAPGTTVLDVGCGTGLSFEPLRQRIGAGGRIVGIEQCPEMLEKARQRVAEGQWHNVTLVCAPAAAARMPRQADAALFHFTHDILRDDKAIAHVLGHLKPGARVVATGLRWAPAWMWPTNAFVMLAALYSVTSLEGLGQAWDKLAARLADVRVETAWMGGIFVASGVYAPA